MADARVSTASHSSAGTRVSKGFIAAYAFAQASLWLALLTPMMITIALRMQQLAPLDASNAVSVVLSIGAVVALIANPFFGGLSDQTHSRFGRRRPWLIGGSVAGLLSLCVTAIASTPTGVLLGWCLTQLSFNAVIAALLAVLPDRVPPAQRGVVSGILGVCMPIGQVGGTYLVKLFADDLMLAFVIPGGISLIAACVFAAVLARQPPSYSLAESLPAPVPEERPSELQIMRHADFVWAWLSRVCFVIGTVLLSTYQPFFLLDVLHADPGQVPTLVFRSMLVQAAMVVVCSFFAGRWSDAIGRRKIFVFIGAAMYALGLWVIAAAGTYPMFFTGIALIGTGNGFFVSTDLALMTLVLPDQYRHAAKGLGIVNITNTLPQVIAPVMGPALLALTAGRYSLLFAMAGVICLFGSLFLLLIKSVR